MTSECEILEKRIGRLEFQNRSLKWLGITLAVLVLGTAVWSQTKGNGVIQAQKFELRDDTGHLRTELAILEGRAALRFFDADGEVESLLADDQFIIFKKGGDIQASFARDGLAFEDGHGKVFVTLGVNEKEQMGKLGLNNYRNNVDAVVTSKDLAKLLRLKSQ
jgi:hypothetical protein